MNLSKLFELQKDLDERIEQQHPRQEGEDRLAKKILALQVEFGELANEWRGFKFWSDDQEPRTSLFAPGVADEYNSNPLLEEYVDVLHFILSIGLEVGLPVKNLYRTYDLRTDKEMITIQFQLCFNDIAGFNMSGDIYYINELISDFGSLGKMLGFTWEQIEAAYLAKNEVNHSRQDNGY